MRNCCYHGYDCIVADHLAVGDICEPWTVHYIGAQTQPNANSDPIAACEFVNREGMGIGLIDLALVSEKSNHRDIPMNQTKCTRK